jgi:hypothetical protein
LKLGLVRAEYAVDHNSGTGAIFFRFGERFWGAWVVGYVWLFFSSMEEIFQP